ncbi:hypothetical protein D0Z08_14630 [Nocardioides immobilis]|uniref:Pyrroline-5-carboxylate reductase catalytic N-terminal domain-containing protein n=1 Tax=Nocardioides immobilis TaxID=2049295 RepID=A0A417Y0P0_9ACTN|nr:NAD(P)-binding domain-containing protein [Nocardioides immobilis]RHW26209.1 hypothetical protein D0Z08_14630 [Nocardioides immobilis]
MGERLTIAVIGGTGPQGRGLAYRFALAQHDVALGSRDAGRASEKADQLAGKIVISWVNPLGFDRAGPFGLVLEESAAQEAQRLVPSARVVGAPTR